MTNETQEQYRENYAVTMSDDYPANTFLITGSATTAVAPLNDKYKNSSETKTRLHECHCGPNAPCRISGKCTCMAGLMKKLAEDKK